MPDLTIAVVYPELLGLYADRGNATALRHRAHAHGLEVDVLDIAADDPVPESADIYLLGGAEDASMLVALERLRASPALGRAVDGGAVVLAVCAGFQLVSRSFAAQDGRRVEGLGLLDATSRHLSARAVGEIVVDSPLVGELQGFENHLGDASIGPGVVSLGRVVRGVGNGHDGVEGAVCGRVLGTYLHGPVVARNPALADHLLSEATGTRLPPVEDLVIERLRAERREALLDAGPTHWLARLRRRRR